VAVSRRQDRSLRFFAADFVERKRTTVPNLKYKREDRWANYPKGVLYEFVQTGYEIDGLNITISSEIPSGIGLGASSAITTATAFAVRALFGFDMGDSQIIHSASLAETAFMGLRGGIADQLVSTVAREKHALFVDTRTLDYANVPFVFPGTTFVVTLSNVPPTFSDSDISERLGLCTDCLEYLQKRKSGTALRDYTLSDIKESLGSLPERARRLCLHVVEENHRVLEGRQMLAEGDMVGFGKVLNRSHESLRDYFEVSCPELDWLVKRAWELAGVYGSRMTGAGFGGCTLTSLRTDQVKTYLERLDEYERIFGFAAKTFNCEASSGASVDLGNGAD
jgi:galactokinase